MQWLTPWTVIGAVLCVLALVVLFFPFIFKIDFEAGLNRVQARLFIFKKQLYKFEKKFSEEKATDDEDAVVPTYVPPKKKTEIKPDEKSVAAESKDVAISADETRPQAENARVIEKEESQEGTASENSVSETSVEPAESVVTSRSPEPAKEKLECEKAAEPAESTEESTETAESAPVAATGTAPVAASGSATATGTAAGKKEKAEKRSLTDTEFWTILLTPEFDETAFGALKKLFFCLMGLFRVRFVNCFVEGFRGEMAHMGYGAAFNGYLKGFPYICDWDFRMDWTHDHEFRTAGQVRASVNLCRLVGLFIATLFYGGIIAFKFWRRRAHVLKTNELPELGWIRTKIVKMMAEE